MPLTTLKDVLTTASETRTAIPGFNIDNIEIPEAIMVAAERCKYPVILTIGQGAIGGVEDGVVRDNRNLVDVREVERFIAAVDVDALAVGIGNAHGMYKGLPQLDFELLQQCQALNPPPLVLHGGSGIPDDMIRRAIEIGIRKINVATEVRNAFMAGLESSVGGRDIYSMYRSAADRVTALAENKMRLFQRLDGLANIS